MFELAGRGATDCSRMLLEKGKFARIVGIVGLEGLADVARLTSSLRMGTAWGFYSLGFQVGGLHLDHSTRAAPKTRSDPNQT
jgi:hypothetical protein